ncbi:Mu transposase C-terminal domain-containing protein [Dongshaea marina]|uniref:Mu transposase C-terminal domain-containing protein n=1 Tax=Dongshaea marina TaxID=2047966 RepID=UPI001F2831B2|nr:Mu transposase C-terminal domain-containing protein [Dongshaea marina]
MNHLRYDSEELSDYRKQYIQMKKSIKIIIKIDPDDISRIYVLLEKFDKYLAVPCVDPIGYTKNLSLNYHLTLTKAHRDYINSKIDIVSLAKARLWLHERIESEQTEFKSKGGKEYKT